MKNPGLTISFYILLASLACSSLYGGDPETRADQLLDEGLQKREKGELQSATQLLENALALYRENRDPGGEAMVLKELGNTYHLLGEHRKAIDLQAQCLTLAKTIDDKDLQARALVNLGISLHAMGLDDQALEHYEKSLQVARENKNTSVEAIVLFNQAALFVDQGKYPEALIPLRAAAALAERWGDTEKQIGAQVYLGLVYSNLGQGMQAIAHYQVALDLIRKIKNPVQEGTVLNSLAHEYHKSGEPSKALELSLQALAVGREIDHPEIQANALRGLTLSYLILSDFLKLLPAAEQLRVFAQKIMDPTLEESAALYLALAHSELGEEEKAVQAYRELLTLARMNKNPENVAAALQALGDAASLKGDHEKAIELYRELLAVAGEIPDPAKEGTAILSLGSEYESLGREGEALAAFQEALWIAERWEDKLGKSKALRKLSLALLKGNDVLRGIDSLDQAYTLLEEVSTSWEENGLLPGAKDLYGELRADLRAMTAHLSEISQLIYGEEKSSLDESQRTEAQVSLPRIAERSLSRARRFKDRESEARLLAFQGDLSLRNGDVDNAIELTSQALEISRELRIESIEQECLGILVNAYAQRNDVDSSIRYEQDLLAIARRQGEPLRQSVILSMLASDYSRKGDLTKALETAEEAVTLAATSGNQDVEMEALRILVSVAFFKGDDAVSIRWGQKTLDLAQARNDRESEAQALQILSQAHRNRGDYVQATKVCHRGLDIADRILTPSFLLCLGISYDALQDFDKAGDFLSRALQLAQESKDFESEAMILDWLGHHSLLLGDRAIAIEQFEKSAKLRFDLVAEPFMKASANLSLAAIQVLQDKFHEAIPLYEKSLELLDLVREAKYEAMRSEMRARTLGLLALAYAALGETEKSLTYAEREWETVRGSAQPTSRALGLHDLGHAFFLNNQLESAERKLREAILEWETAGKDLAGASWERASLLDAQSTTYDLLQQVLVAANRKEEALEVSERGRARLLTEAMALRPGGESAQQPAAPPAIEQIRRFALEKNVTFVEYSILYDSTGALFPGRVGGAQPEEEKDLFIWVVKPGGEIAFAKVDLRARQERGDGSLAGKIRILRSLLRGQDDGALSNNLRQLHDLLITPIVDHLPRRSEDLVVFIPQGPLFLVPFPALIDPSGRSLLEKHTNLSAPSIQALISIPGRVFQPSWKGEEALVVGNPAIAAELKLAPYNLQELSGAQAEATTLATGLKARALTGEEAKKQEILRLLPQSRLLHFASHGLLEGFGDPLIPGALVFAPSQDDNGLLTAREIAGMDLRADLAVLSACDTGRGRITSGGVSGLASALISAGVPNIVVSLWKVPDEATQFLMLRFYQELADSPDPARALRQAMLETKKAYPTPQSWAGFTLIGGLH